MHRLCIGCASAPYRLCIGSTPAPSQACSAAGSDMPASSPQRTCSSSRSGVPPFFKKTRIIAQKRTMKALAGCGRRRRSSGHVGPHSYGPYSCCQCNYGLYSYGLYSYGLYSYGLYSYGRRRRSSSTVRIQTGVGMCDGAVEKALITGSDVLAVMTITI